MRIQSSGTDDQSSRAKCKQLVKNSQCQVMFADSCYPYTLTDQIENTLNMHITSIKQ